MLLKELSFLCGCNIIYDGSYFGKKILGMGLIVKLLIENNIVVYSE